MTSDYYVYALLDGSKPGNYQYVDYYFDYEPFYIGKGKGKRIKDTLYDKASFKKNKISKLKRNNIKIISLKLLEGLSNEEALFKEIEIISIVGRRDFKKGPLVNTTDGGDGRSNSPHSEEVRKKISKNRKGKGVGWKHKKETLLLMSENQKGDKNGFYGKKHKKITKKNQSKRVSGLLHPMFGKKHKKETLNLLKKHRSENISNENIKLACQKFNKPVLMYDLSFNFIKEFNSVKETSIETGINESIISKCCRGDIKSPTRYFFRYKNKEDNIKNNKFLINKGDSFIMNNEVLSLVKRNKKTCICKDINSNLVTIHMDDFDFLFTKETNDIDIIELFLFLKNNDSSFKIKNNIIYNDLISIKYLKSYDLLDIFPDKNLDDVDIIINESDWDLKKDEIKRDLIKKTNFYI